MPPPLETETRPEPADLDTGAAAPHAPSTQPAVTVDESDGVDECGYSTRTPLLVLGTTMAELNGKTELSSFKKQTQLNSVRAMLAQHSPGIIRPLVFTKSHVWEATVRSAGLEPSFSADFDTRFEGVDNEHGWPTFASLMSQAQRLASASRAPFFGFANADIAFTEDLAMTLRMVKSAHQAGFFRKNHAYGGGQKHQHSDSGSSAGVLLVGRRTNFAVDKHFNLDLGMGPSAHGSCERSQHMLAMAKHGQLFGEASCDFFVMLSEEAGFDWSRFPDYLIGVPAYDQAVIGRAIDAGMTVIDVTETVHAFHQSGAEDGNYAGFRGRSDQARLHNEQLWAHDVNKCGHVDCAQFKSTWTPERRPALIRLSPPTRSCFDRFGRAIPGCTNVAKKGVHDQRGTAIAAAEGDLFEQECAADRERAHWSLHLPSAAAAPSAFSYLLYLAQQCLRFASDPTATDSVYGGAWRADGAALWKRLGCAKLYPAFPEISGSFLETTSLVQGPKPNAYPLPTPCVDECPGEWRKQTTPTWVNLWECQGEGMPLVGSAFAPSVPKPGP